MVYWTEKATIYNTAITSYAETGPSGLTDQRAKQERVSFTNLIVLQYMESVHACLSYIQKLKNCVRLLQPMQ